jgi:hypothetical protein
MAIVGNAASPRIACRQMITDARRTGTGPGGHLGAATGSSAAGLHPAPALRRSHFPDPPLTTLRQQSQPIPPAAPGALHHRRTTAAVKRSLLDGGEDRRTLSRPGMTPLDTEGSHDRVVPEPVLAPVIPDWRPRRLII